MGRHDQRKEAVLSPRAVEGAKQSHFKTLFQDPSPSQVGMSMKGLKRVPFKTPNVKQSTHTVRILAYGANPAHFRTIIHNSNHRNDKTNPFQDPNWQVLKQNKISSFQDLLSRSLREPMVCMVNLAHFKTLFQDP